MAQITGWTGTLLWPFVRVTAFVMALPIFSGRGMPMRVRLVFSLALLVAVLPAVGAAPAIDPITPEGVLVAAQQIAIGVSMGFMLRLVFAAILNAGQITSLGMGLGFASMVDPSNGIQVPVISVFYNILATLLFFALDGHLVMVQVLAESFQVLPVSTHGFALRGYYDIALWASWMFSGAVLLALPAMTAILIINLAFGVMTRAAPQLNIFAVGFPVTITAGFVVMLVTLGDLGDVFVQLTRSALDMLRQIISQPG